jgi:hypothetical protein
MKNKQEQIYIDGTIDRRVERAEEATARARSEQEAARERKDEAGRIYRMKTMHAGYLAIEEQIIKARAESAGDGTVHYAVVDRGRGPMVCTVSETMDFTGEWICYAVFMGGNEIEDFPFDEATLKYEADMGNTGTVSGTDEGTGTADGKTGG